VAVKLAGQDSARAMGPETASVPLHSAGKASVFCARNNEHVAGGARADWAITRCQPAEIGHESGAGLGGMERVFGTLQERLPQELRRQDHGGAGMALD